MIQRTVYLRVVASHHQRNRPSLATVVYVLGVYVLGVYVLGSVQSRTQPLSISSSAVS